MSTVVVVGAGLAGLAAARRRAARGHEVTVVEARARVGGRTEGLVPADGTPLELGGAWLDEGHTRMYELVRELGLSTHRTWNDEGQLLLDLQGKRLLVKPRKGRRSAYVALRRRGPGPGPAALCPARRRIDLERPAGWSTTRRCRPGAISSPSGCRPARSSRRSRSTPSRSGARTGSTQAASDTGPVKVTFDTSPPSGTPGVLLGFLEGKQARLWARRSQAERRETVVGCFVRYFGRAVARPQQYVERDWMAEGVHPRLLRRTLRAGGLDVLRRGVARAGRAPALGRRGVRPAVERLQGRRRPQRRGRRGRGRGARLGRITVG